MSTTALFVSSTVSAAFLALAVLCAPLFLSPFLQLQRDVVVANLNENESSSGVLSTSSVRHPSRFDGGSNEFGSGVGFAPSGQIGGEDDTMRQRMDVAFVPAFPVCTGDGLLRFFLLLPFGSRSQWSSTEFSLSEAAQFSPDDMPLPLRCLLPSQVPIWRRFVDMIAFFIFFSSVLANPLIVAARSARMASSFKHSSRIHRSSWVGVLASPLIAWTVCGALLVSHWLLLAGNHQRMMPWMFQLPVLLCSSVAATGMTKRSRAVGTHGAQLMVAAWYFWGGWRKMSAGFGAQILPSMISGTIAAINGSAPFPYVASELDVHILGPLVAVTEMIAAIALLARNPWVRRGGASFFILMHAGIVLALVKLELNGVIVVWATVLTCLVIFEFIPLESTFDPSYLVVGCVRMLICRGKSRRLSDYVAGLVVATSLLIPFAGQFNLFDSYQSGEMHTGNPALGWVVWNSNDAMKKAASTVDPTMSSQLRARYFNDEGNFVDFASWSFDAMNVPLVPEWRMFAGLSRLLCDLARNAGADTTKSLLRYVPRRDLFDFETDRDLERGSFDISCQQLQTLGFSSTSPSADETVLER